MTDLKELCCDFLEQCITPSNCLGIHEFTEQFSCPRVHHKADVYLDEHFRLSIDSEMNLILCLASWFLVWGICMLQYNRLSQMLIFKNSNERFFFFTQWYHLMESAMASLSWKPFWVNSKKMFRNDYIIAYSQSNYK